MLQGLDQALVSDTLEERFQLLLIDVKEPVLAIVRGAVGQDIVSGKATLPPRRNKNDDRLGRRMFDDRQVGGFRHSDHE
jgi:hypothetical protein